MTRALWVTDEQPDRNGHGGPVRQAHLLSSLASHMPVRLLLCGDDPRPDTPAVTTETVESPRPTPSRSRPRMLWHLLAHSEPLEIRDGAAARARLRALIDRRTSADLVIVHHAWLGPLVDARRRGQRWVLDLHNLPSIKARHAAETSTAVWRRWRWRREAAKAGATEGRLASAYDLVIVPSAEDAAALRSGRVVVVPNGVEPTRFNPRPLPHEPRLVFTGSLDYPPNIDGLRWFVEEVWSRIRRRSPAAVLDIVGFRPSAPVHALASAPGVTVVGEVPDTVPFLHRARLAIVPLRIGSGTRLKALEAMACGRPVVGTSIGLEGLDLRDGEHARIADSPEEMAGAVQVLLQDKEQARRLASAGRTRALTRFSWDRVGARFVRALLAGETTR